MSSFRDNFQLGLLYGSVVMAGKLITGEFDWSDPVVIPMSIAMVVIIAAALAAVMTPLMRYLDRRKQHRQDQ